jgi:hypothetical protein
MHNFFLSSGVCNVTNHVCGGALRQPTQTAVPNTNDASPKQGTITGGLDEDPQPILEPWTMVEVFSNAWHDNFFNSIRRAVAEPRSRMVHPFRELQSV